MCDTAWHEPLGRGVRGGFGAGFHQLWGYGSAPSGGDPFHQQQGWQQLCHSSAVGLAAPFINCRVWQPGRRAGQARARLKGRERRALIDAAAGLELASG